MNSDKKRNVMSRHYCPTLDAGVVTLQSENGECRCLSSHLCGGESSSCEKDRHGKAFEYVNKTQA